MMRNDYTDYISHSSPKHKYIAKVGSRYFYDRDEYNTYKSNKGKSKSSTKLRSKANSIWNGRNPGIHQTPTRGAAGKAYTVKKSATSAGKTIQSKIGSVLKGRNPGIHQTPSGGLDHLAYKVKKTTTRATNLVKNSKAGLITRDVAKSAGRSAKNFFVGDGRHASGLEKATWKAQGKLAKASYNAKKFIDVSKPKVEKAVFNAGVQYRKAEKNFKENVAPKLKSEAKALIKRMKQEINSRESVGLKTYNRINSAYDDVLDKVRNSDMDEVDKAMIEKNINRAKNDLELAAKASRKKKKVNQNA